MYEVAIIANQDIQLNITRARCLCRIYSIKFVQTSKMSSADDNIVVAEARMMCCASCGKSEVDDVKLIDCADCKSVRYCSDNCREDHRPEHEAKCKERAAELRDEILFRQPESTHLGDCPICSLPMPIEDEKVGVASCSSCSKLICNGCSFADWARQQRENMRVIKCPFCRIPVSTTDEEFNKNLMKRAEQNDPAALRRMGLRHARREEYDKTFEYFTRAAELGDADAHYNLSIMYNKGQCVEKDETKRVYHLEEAAIAGQPSAHHSLGYVEWNKERYNRALKHWIIAANLGYDRSIKELKNCYQDGDVSKEDFAAALRAHHAAVNATKSPQRDEAEKAKYADIT